MKTTITHSMKTAITHSMKTAITHSMNKYFKLYKYSKKKYFVRAELLDI